MNYMREIFIKLIKATSLITLLIAFFTINSEVAFAQSLERQHKSQIEIAAQARLDNVVQLKLLDTATGKFKVLTLDENLKPLSETQAKLALTREESKRFTGKLELDLAELVSRLRSKESFFSFKGVIPKIMIPVVVWAKINETIPKVNRISKISEMSRENNEGESVIVLKELNLRSTKSLRKFVDESTLGFVKYQSQYAPILILDVSLSLLTELEQRDDVQAIFLAHTYNSDLNNSVKAIGADEVWARGITGDGVKTAVVEKGGIYFDHVDLKNGIYCNKDHPNINTHATRVAGVIASMNSRFKGVAHRVPALFSGNTIDYEESSIVACTDEAIRNKAHLINMSFGAPFDSELKSIDRYVDYIVRTYGITVVTSAGNEIRDIPGSYIGTCSRENPYVGSPGRGWNVITVGNYNDNNTVDTDDDEIMKMSETDEENDGTGSCYGNPSSPYGDLEKPEVVAPGTAIVSTCANGSNCFNNGTGTSIAAPHVTGCAALLMERKESLENSPESIRAVLMASAIKSFREDSPPDSSDRYYAAGGIRCDLADDIVRGFNGMESHGTYSENNFPITYTFRAYRTQDVRVVVAWNSDTGPFDRPWETDVLNANLDLKVFGPNGSLVGSSSSQANSYEIVQFTANSTGTYTAQVDALRFDGDDEYLGFAVWKSSPPQDCSIIGCPSGKICCDFKCTSLPECP